MNPLEDISHTRKIHAVVLGDIVVAAARCVAPRSWLAQSMIIQIQKIVASSPRMPKPPKRNMARYMPSAAAEQWN